MVITYHGAQYFKVTHGDTTIAFNPVSKESSYETTNFGADVAFVSLHHPDFNGVSQLERGAKAPFKIHGPGEYEVGDITAVGSGVSVTYDNTPHINTVYQVSLEDMNLVFLGAIESSDQLTSEILGTLGDIDILFLPIGGGELLNATAASKLAVKLEARLVIPMQYDAAALKEFLKEESAESTKPQEKITIKRRDVAAMEGEVMVLAS